MKTLTAILERNEDAYFAYTDEIEGCVAGGNSFEEVKQNMKKILNTFIEEDVELKSKYKEGTKLVFYVSLDTFFDLIPEINISQLAKLGNINPSLLRQYASGTKKASERQAKKIMRTLEKLAIKLNEIAITA